MLHTHFLQRTRSFITAKWLNILYGILVSLGVGFAVYVFLGLGPVAKAPQPIKAVVSPAQKPVKIAPSAIDIPKIKRNLPIKSAKVTGNNWDLFDDAVAWLSTSQTPGNGNVILYAHDWKPLWRDIYKLVPGDEILVLQEGKWHPYAVTESRLVNEHDIASILSDQNRLTLYTCEGTFDDKRRVVYAEPKSL